MAPEDNWLSFSLSSMEMMNSGNTSQVDPQQYCFVDNFYSNGWNPSKIDQNMYTEEITNHNQTMNHHTAPKLEDFFAGDSSAAAAMVQYSDSQTDTQDSSLTHIYDQTNTPAAAYFTDQQDLKAITRTTPFQAFSNNSGSEVDDSRTHEFAAQSTESRTELAYSQQNALSLGVNNNNNTQICDNNKAIVSVSSDSCKKISDTFGQRTSIYRGVTRHRWTGRYEAHLWDNSCRREGQARKGRQVYLGGYDKEEKAARAYDLAALKYWGPNATTNFPISTYSKEVEDMNNVTKQEFIASLRRKSSGFSRGASIYRGVTRHHQQGRWQARIGRVAGNKDLYLGTFATEEEAAEAYDIAAIKFRGANAVTNFEMNRYDVEAIANTSLPVGGAAKRLKISLEAEQKTANYNHQQLQLQAPPCTSETSINFGSSALQPISTIPYGVPYDSTSGGQLYQHHFFHHGNVGSSEMPPPPPEFFMWSHQSY